MPHPPTPPSSHPTLAECSRTAATTPNSVLLHTALPDAENRHTLLFTHPVQILTATQLHQIPALFASIQSALDHGHHVAGFLSYEAGYHFEPKALQGPLATDPTLPLAWFGVYQAPLPIDSTTLPNTPTHLPEPPTPTLSLSAAQYRPKIQSIREKIAAGDLYQANFTLSAQFPWPHTPDSLFATILQSQPTPYTALLHLQSPSTSPTHILSASPELFFLKRGPHITVRPMKGTAPRGLNLAEDAQNAAWLASDPKNRAENLMIVDLMRSDLGRISQPGSVHVPSLFATHRYPSLLQMTSTVTAELLPNTSLYTLFRSLFPCGSITGAPKVRTMQLIRQLEDAPRGIACGAIGHFTPSPSGNHDATFSVAIRTITLHQQQARIRIGSGITWSSDPDAEYAETLLKSHFLTHPQPQFDLIETLAWTPASPNHPAGHYPLLDLHLDRLHNSATYFNFPCDRQAIQTQLTQYATTLAPANLDQATSHRVRLLLHPTGQITLTSTPLHPTPGPALLQIATQRLNHTDPKLAPFLRHKTTHRAHYDHALAAARAAGHDDAIFLNTHGEVTECAIHNLMIYKAGKWTTPPIESGLLPGTYRQHLLATHPEIQIAPITLKDLQTARKILIFNSVRGLRRAHLIHPPKP